MNTPTTTTATLADGTKVTVERLPELAHRGVGFRAYCTSSPNGIDASSDTECGAIEALQEAIQQHIEDRAEREAELAAERGFPSWNQRY